MPTSEPTQRPVIVNQFSERLAAVAVEPEPLTLAQIAMQRADALDALGLGSDNVDVLSARLKDMSPGDFDSLIDAVFVAGKATLDRLRRDAASAEPPTALWATGDVDARRLIGQTLLWADHYLVTDHVAEHFLRVPDRGRVAEAAEALAGEMRMRPLLGNGAIALVPEEVVQVLVAERAYAATEADLARPELVKWVMSQLQVSGPTEREAIVVEARDAHPMNGLFFYSHIEGANDDGTFKTVMLAHRYDPAHDYGPWIDHCRRQVTAERIQAMNFNVEIAAALCGQVIVTAPFDARMLARKGGDTITAPQGLIWADVPSLPGADRGTLVRIANEEAAVAALRKTMRRGMSAAADPAAAGAEIAEQLREDAAALTRTIGRDRLWKFAVPVALGVAGLGVGAITGGAAGAAAAALGAASGLSPLVADRGANRENPAYAVYLADRARRRGG